MFKRILSKFKAKKTNPFATGGIVKPGIYHGGIVKPDIYHGGICLVGSDDREHYVSLGAKAMTVGKVEAKSITVTSSEGKTS